MAIDLGAEGCIFRWWIRWNGVHGIHQTAASSVGQHRFPCRTVRPGHRFGVDGDRNDSFADWSRAFLRSSNQLRHYFTRPNSDYSQFGQHDFKLKLWGCGFWCLVWIMVISLIPWQSCREKNLLSIVSSAETTQWMVRVRSLNAVSGFQSGVRPIGGCKHAALISSMQREVLTLKA